jgi:L-alanine-DL-glutamate epimerase-like enolase superfamily enzyme
MTPAGAQHKDGGRRQGRAYALLAGLPLRIESYSTQRLQLDVSSGFTRATTTILLRGGGHEGRGEDVTYDAEAHDDYPHELPLAGDWNIDSFARHVGGLDLFPGRPPRMEAFRQYRRWGFESAALDLALRQHGVSLGQALVRPYRPVRFVLSTRLDIMPWLAVDPSLEFKLDPTPEWDEDAMRRIAATGRVRVLDFKSFYEGSPVDNPPDARQYALVAAIFPDAILEDPVLSGPARDALNGHEDRFSFDAPIHSWKDVEGLAQLPRFLNIKPSRFGALKELLDCIDLAKDAGIQLYGGGQFELGVGREHIEAMASLFYADGPNDVAPREYHGDARPGVPASPLQPMPQSPGFAFPFKR